jgi:LysR family cys regulon transcriptional activator
MLRQRPPDAFKSQAPSRPPSSTAVSERHAARRVTLFSLCFRGITMTLRQLTYLTRLIQCHLNISETARRLHTSQSGVSRYLGLLEDELGVQIFIREDRRLVGLTPAGAEIARVAQRMLLDAQTLRDIGRSGGNGQLTIATAHTQARYILPAIIEKFLALYPGFQIRLLQGTTHEIVEWTLAGVADFFIGPVFSEVLPELTLIACSESHRLVVVPPRHPLLRVKELSLKHIAAYPIVTYDQNFSVRSQLLGTFQREGLSPNVVLSAADSEVIKAYVRVGIGIALLSNAVFDEKKDTGLRAIDARNLFGTNIIYVGLRRSTYPSDALLHFVRLYAPEADLHAFEELRAA